ncbi:hypothetical protein, partial [Pseudomonas putida]|uniref:hypothetical protein n=1 Tax=Pseudomonas putida TaxID=303 RepID=UPI003905FE3A
MAQSKQEFKRAAEKLGLTWVDEADFNYPSSDDFHDREKPEKPMEGRLYLTVPNQRAITELLRLWALYSSGNGVPRGDCDWIKFFSHLIVIRSWGVRARLTP